MIRHQYAVPPPSSADYFITTKTTGGPRTINISNPGGGAATNAYGRVYVIRVQ